MKQFKKITAAAMAMAMILALAGCAKNFDPTDKKTFESALEEAYDLDDDEYDSVKNPESTASYSYYSYVLDGTDIFDDYEIKSEVEYTDDDDAVLYFIEFDEAEDAHEWMEDNYFDDIQDAVDDKDIDGSYSIVNTNDVLCFVVNGELDADFYDDDIYGGFYQKDNIVVIAITSSSKEKDQQKIDDLLAAIEYPQP